MIGTVASMDPAPGPQAAPRTSHLDAGAFGDVAASVSMFHAALTQPVTLALVPGRDGLDLRVTAMYSSAAARSARVWNADAPTGVLGLGWSLSADRIVVEGKTSRNPLDGRFLLQSGGVIEPLVWYGSDGGTLLFQCASRPLWRIRYDGVAQTWTVLRDDGSTAVYGYPAGGSGAVMFGVMWGNWTGGSRAASPLLHRYPVAWQLAEVLSPGGSVVSWHYVSEEVPIAGTLSYTRAAYVDRVTGPDGGSVEFRYEPKDPAEYTPPHQTAAGQADPSYQDRYEDLFLAALDVRAGAGTQDLRYSLLFDYELGNVSGSASSAFTKRFLTGIRQMRRGRLELPATRFGYETDPGAPNPGALTSVLYPEGGTAAITYRTVTLGPPGPSATTADHADPDDVFRTSITVHRPPGTVPLVFQGPDYVVLAWYSKASSATEVRVYSVGGRWSKAWTARIAGAVRTEYVRFAGSEAFFALYLANTTGTGPAAVHLFRKRPHRFGDWTRTPYAVDRSATEIPAETTLAAGRDFAVLHLGGERLVHRYWWDPLAAAWATVAHGRSTTRVALAARGEYYAVAWYDQITKRAQYQLFHRDVTGAWQAGPLGAAGEPFDWAPRYAVDYWALGGSFAVATYTLSGAAQRRLRTLQWEADFAVARDTARDGRADRSTVSGSLVGNGPLLLRFDGAQWRDFEFAAAADVRYAYGEDLAVRSVVEGTTTRNTVVAYQAATGTWSVLSAGNQDSGAGPGTPATAPWPPTSSGQLITVGTAVRWRAPDGTLSTIGSLPPAGAAGSLHNAGPSHLIYQNDPADRAAAATTVLVLRNGTVRETVLLPRRRIAVEDPRFAASQMAGPRVFVTYPAAIPFGNTPELRLHRIIGHSLAENAAVPAVATVSVDSGMQVVETGYEYDAARAVFDPTGTTVLFPAATRIIGPAGAGGRAEYSYHTGLPGQGDADDAPYTLFTGMIGQSRTFDADGFEVAGTKTTWSGLTLAAGSASPVGVALKATLPVLVRSEATAGRLSLFGLPLTQIPVLDAGTLSEPVIAAFTAAGLPLTPRARVAVVVPGALWDIADTAAIYPVGRERDAFGTPAASLQVYSGTRKSYINEYDPATGLLVRQEATNLSPDGTPRTIVRSLTPAWRVPEYAAMADAGMFQAIAAERIVDTTAGIGLSACQITYRAQWPAPAPQCWAQYECWTWRAEGALPPAFDRSPDGDRSAWILGERFTARNRFGEPVVSVDATGLATSTLFDIEDRRAVATFVNLDLTAAVPAGCCLGFEPYERTQGWRRGDGLPLETLITTDYPHSGTRCLRLAPGTEVTADFELPPGSGRAFFSCWVRTEPGYIPGPADGWFFDVRPAGAAHGSVVRLPFPGTGGVWQRVQLCLDHPDQATATAVTCRAVNSLPDAACFIDDLRLVPLEGGVSATVYAGGTRLPLAVIDVNNAPTRFYYDDSLRLAAIAGPGPGELRGLGGFAYARGTDADPRAALADGADRLGTGRFDTHRPNAQTTITPIGGGSVEEFSGSGDWRARWAAYPSVDWAVADGVLLHHGDGPGTLTLRGSHDLSWYGVRADVRAGAGTAATAGAIAIGDVGVAWDPSGDWLMTRGGAVVARAAGPRPESGDWMLIAQPYTVLLLIDGRQILAHRFADPVGGTLVLTAGGTVAGFRRITVFRQPSVQVAYSDGVGIVRQSQALDADAVNVSGVLFDELGRPSIQVKAMAYPGAVPGYSSTYAIGLDPVTGRLSGDVTAYYNGSGGRSDDQGYPYTRQRLEAAATGRPVEIGQPGAVHAIAPGAARTTRISHGLKINDDFLDHLPAGQYPVTTVTDPDGRAEVTIQDPAGRTLGVRQAPDAENIRTAYEYDQRGDLVRVLGPDTFAPRPGQDPHAGEILHDVDGLGNVIADHAAGTGTTETVYDDRCLPRFTLYADGRGAGPGGLDRIVYRTYDRLGRRVETGEIERVFDRPELQALAGTAWPVDAPGWREKLRYDGDGSQPDAVGRGWTWTRNPVPGEPPVVTVLEYDASGRVTRCVERRGDESAFQTLYTYHPGGLPDRIVYPSPVPSLAAVPADPAALVVRRSYDLLGRLAAVGTPTDPAAYASYGYTATGAVDHETLTMAGPEPCVRTFSYNAPGMLAAVESPRLTELIACWEEPGDDGAWYYGDQVSRVTSEAPRDGGTVPPSYTWPFSYSGDGRLRTARNTADPDSDSGVGGPAHFDTNGNLMQVRALGTDRVTGPDGAVRGERRYLCAAGAAPLTEHSRPDGGQEWEVTSYIYGLHGLVAVLGPDGTGAAVSSGARLYHPRLCRLCVPDPAGSGANPSMCAADDPVNLAGVVTGAVSFGLVSAATAAVAATVAPVTGAAGTSLGFIARGVVIAAITGAGEGAASGALGQALGNVLNGKRGDDTLDGVNEAARRGNAQRAASNGNSLRWNAREPRARSGKRMLVFHPNPNVTALYRFFGY